MLRSRWILVLTAIVLPIAVTACRKVSQPQPTGPFTLTLSDGGLVTLEAREVPASRILAVLRERHGIAVDVADFRDTTVTVTARDISLDSALVLILPASSRAGTVVLREERDVPARAGDKPGRRVTKESGLPRKDDTRPAPADANRPRKASETDTSVKRPPAGARLKDAPSANIPPPGAREKQPLSRPPSQGDSVVWMSLTIRDATITVDAARLIEGPRIVSTVPQGTYIYVVSAGGRPIAVESFYDPFEQRAYAPQPDAPHRVARDRTGRFTATIPMDALRGVAVEQLTLRVLVLRPGARVARIDVAGVSDTTRTFVPVATASGEALRAALAPLMAPR